MNSYRVVRTEGLEPPTLWFEARCSIQLSYVRIGVRILRDFLTIVNLFDILCAHSDSDLFRASE